MRLSASVPEVAECALSGFAAIQLSSTFAASAGEASLLGASSLAVAISMAQDRPAVYETE